MLTRLGLAFYRALASLLPPGARDDRGRMVTTLSEMVRGASGPRAVLVVLLWSLVRLPGVIVVEWIDFVDVSRKSGSRERGGGMGFARDIRYAVRTLRRAPGFTLMSVGLMAVGVGMVTAVFTLMDHVLLRPLPYPDAERLVWVGSPSHSGPFFQAISTQSSVDQWAASMTGAVILTGTGDPQRLQQARVDENFFALFGGRAAFGRLFAPTDFTSPDVAVLSYPTWVSRFAADPGIVGRSVSLDGSPVVVVGILDPALALPEALVGASIDLWRPIDWAHEWMVSSDVHVLTIAGRLAPGFTLEAAQDEMDATVASLAAEDANFEDDDGGPRDLPLATLADATVDQPVRSALYLMMAAVGMLLLIACSNVAHLFLARGLGRLREMAVRRALGAGSATLIRQLLAESLVVALAGGVVGIGVAWGALAAFEALNPTALPRGGSVALDGRVLIFALLAASSTSVIFGLLPALRGSKVGVADHLRGGGRGATGGRGVARLRNALVSAEVALSLVLVASAGLFLRSLMSVRAQDAGFDIEGVWTVPLTPTRPESREELAGLMHRVRDAVASVPGVTAATYGLTMPLEMTGGSRCCWGGDIQPYGEEREDPDNTLLHVVDETYFSTLGIEFAAGAGWGAKAGQADPPPIVLGQPLAVSLFGSADAAVGRAVTYGGSRTLTVVGVTKDHHHFGLESDHGMYAHVPFDLVPGPISKANVAFTTGSTGATDVVRAVREAIWSVDPALPVPTIRSMREAVDRSTAGRRFDSALYGAFALVALLLAAAGLYGALLFLAGERRREMGIRLALGASPAGLQRQLLRAGLGIGAAGVAIGLAGAFLSGRILESRIWGVGATDPVTLATASLVLLITAALASWLPARRAGRTDPLEALRAE